MGFEVLERGNYGGAMPQARARMIFPSGGRQVFITLTNMLASEAGLESGRVEVLVGNGAEHGTICLRASDNPLNRRLSKAATSKGYKGHIRVSITPLRSIVAGDRPFLLTHEVRPDGLYLRIPPDRLKQPMPEAAE